MSQHLEFPDRDAINQPDFNPILHQPNGVTYYWDAATSSWILMSAQSVNKDYVDARDELRYRRDGSDFIYGNVIIRPESDETLDPTIIINKKGKLMMDGENTIHFMSGTAELPKLTYGTAIDPVVVFDFDSNYLRHNLINFFESGKTSTIIKVDNTGDDEVDLFDIKTLGNTSIAKHIIRLEENKDCHFVVGGGQLDNGSFTIRGDNSVRVVTDSDLGFIVANSVATSSEARNVPFKVEPDTHKITTSMAYSEGLIEGGAAVSTSVGNVYTKLNEHNLVATKGYVDAKSQNNPGFNVCANKESDAKSGGFWRSGSNLFWKL